MAGHPVGVGPADIDDEEELLVELEVLRLLDVEVDDSVEEKIMCDVLFIVIVVVVTPPGTILKSVATRVATTGRVRVYVA